MPTYPSTLPAPRIDSLQETPADLLLRTKMDSGVDKVRKKFSFGADQLSYIIRLTLEQRNTLMTFYKTTVSSGAATFDYTNPITGEAVTARFVKAPAPKLSGHKMYDANIDIEIIP